MGKGEGEVIHSLIFDVGKIKVTHGSRVLKKEFCAPEDRCLQRWQSRGRGNGGDAILKLKAEEVVGMEGRNVSVEKGKNVWNGSNVRKGKRRARGLKGGVLDCKGAAVGKKNLYEVSASLGGGGGLLEREPAHEKLRGGKADGRGVTKSLKKERTTVERTKCPSGTTTKLMDQIKFSGLEEKG